MSVIPITMPPKGGKPKPTPAPTPAIVDTKTGYVGQGGQVTFTANGLLFVNDQTPVFKPPIPSGNFFAGNVIGPYMANAPGVVTFTFTYAPPSTNPPYTLTLTILPAPVRAPKKQARSSKA